MWGQGGSLCVQWLHNSSPDCIMHVAISCVKNRSGTAESDDF